jgi:acyl dehydratase
VNGRVHPDDYDIDAVRAEWVGKMTGGSEGRYAVEHDPIRRHCHMVGDTNPLFLDPETAARGPYGAVVVPPSMLPVYFATRGPWPPAPTPSDGDDAPVHPGFTFGVPTPGDRGINLAVEWEYAEPIRVGDRLRMTSHIADVHQKPIRLDPHAVWIVLEARIFNQHDVLVATWRNTVVVYRSPQQIAEDDARSKTS